MNAFIAFAGALAAGLHGIENELELPDECAANAYAPGLGYPTLAPTLGEAAARLRDSAVARHYLGDAFVDHYAATRQWEQKRYNRAVTSWELERYFEVI